MGTDAIAELGRAAAVAALEKQAFGFDTLGRGLQSAATQLLTRGTAGGGRTFSLLRPLLAAGAGVAGVDAIGGMKGKWGGQGGTNWHPWSNPSNWLKNIFLHPVRSIAEATGRGDPGSLYSDVKGKPIQMTHNGQMGEFTPTTREWSPAVMQQVELQKRLTDQMNQNKSYLQSVGYPGAGPAAKPATPAAPENPLVRPDVDYAKYTDPRVTNPNSAMRR